MISASLTSFTIYSLQHSCSPNRLKMEVNAITCSEFENRFKTVTMKQISNIKKITQHEMYKIISEQAER